MKSSLSPPFDVLMLGLSNWNQMSIHNTRCKQFALHFARNEHIRKVVHVSPIRPMGKKDHLMLILHHLHHQKKTVFFPPCRLTQVSEKLFDLFIGYPFISPKFTDLLFSKEKMIIRALQKIICILRLENLILWIASPAEHYLIGKLGEQISIFDTVDDLSLVPTVYPGGGELAVNKNYNQINKKVNLIFTNSKKMLEKFSRKKHIYWISNGTDTKRFKKILENNNQEPEDIKALLHPRIIYIGSITLRVDINLLEYLASRNIHWNIVLVGYIAGDIDASTLLQMKNVKWLGPKPYDNIPNYLKFIDACLVPMKVSPITHAMDPLKVYDYLAAGKPVVATDLSGLKKYGDLIKIGKNYEEFEYHIKQILANEPVKDIIKERKAFVDNQSWENKVNQSLDIIAKYPDLHSKKIQ